MSNPKLSPYITVEEYNHLLVQEEKSRQHFYFTNKKPPEHRDTQAAFIMATLYKKANIFKNMIDRGLRINDLFLNLQKYSTFNVNGGDKIPYSFFVGQYASADMFLLILPHINIHRMIAERDSTLLHIAARGGKTQVIRQLLLKGATPSQKSAPYFTTTLETALEFDSYYRSPVSSVLRSKEDNQKSIETIRQNVEVLLEKSTPDILCSKDYSGHSWIKKCIQDKQLLSVVELILNKALEFKIVDKIQAHVLELKQNKEFFSLNAKEIQDFETIFQPYAEKQMFQKELKTQIQQSVFREYPLRHKI